MPEKLRILTIEPTVFFVRDGEALRQQVRVTVDNPGEAVAASLTVRSESIDVSLTLDRMGSGETVHEVYLPDLRSPAELTFAVHARRRPHAGSADRGVDPPEALGGPHGPLLPSRSGL